MQKPLLKKVFFVDDDEATNAFHKALSADFGLASDLKFFADPRIALSELERIQNAVDLPEMIFLDINMPQMGGHEFVKRANNLPAFDKNKCCIVLLTTSKHIEDVITADQNNVAHYYWKPLNAEVLAQIMKEGLNIDR